MSPATQAKLLRVLADGKVLRIGSTKPREVDVRVLVATHRNLEERARQGTFRQDLYYRLAVVPIALPPLRQRREDIPGLCELFSREVSRDLKLPARRIDRRAIEKLAKYDFPGNVRELRNLIERAMILSRSVEIGPDDFPIPTNETAMPHGNGGSGLLDAPEVVNLREYLENLEKRLILRALKASNGVQAEAARRLHLSRSDLAYKLAKYAIAAEALQ
jgi:DNA-binding NtrC family response regulator